MFSCIVTGMKKTADTEMWPCVKSQHTSKFLIFTVTNIDSDYNNRNKIKKDKN